MRAVTQPDSPPHSHRMTQQPAVTSQQKNHNANVISSKVPADSPQAERLDELVGSFVKRAGDRLDDAWVAICDAVELDDDSRLIPLDNRSQSDHPKVVDDCALIASHVRGLFDMFVGDSSEPATVESIWQDCFRNACAAVQTTGAGQRGDSVKAFARGMVCDMGRLVLVAAYPKAYERVIRATRAGEDHLCEVELRAFGVDHVAVGRHLLSRPNVPDVLLQLAESHFCEANSAATQLSEHAFAAKQLMRDIETLMKHYSGDDKGIPAKRELNQPTGAINENSVTPTLVRLMQQIADLPNRARTVDQHCSETARIVFDVIGISRFVVFAPVDPKRYHVCVFDGATGPAEPQRVVVQNEAGVAHDLDFDSIIVQDAHATAHSELADRFVRTLGPGNVGLLPFLHGPLQSGGMLFSLDGDRWRLDQIGRDSLRIIVQTLGAVFESASLARRLNTPDRRTGSQRAEQQVAIRTETIKRVAQMAAGAAHEFNNPLAIIAGRAQLLQSDPQNQSIQSDLLLIATQARRAGDMVSELMDYARPATPNPVEIRLDIWANRLRQHWHRESGFAPGQIQVHLQSDDVFVFADEGQIRAAADAIMDNAVAAVRTKIGPGGIKSADFANIQINSPSTSTDDTIVVAISDNGGGMPPDVCEHALDPFFSHRAAGRRRGLGLSRAARYIEVNGGQLWIDSTEGVGTTVSFSLPARSGKPLGI